MLLRTSLFLSLILLSLAAHLKQQEVINGEPTNQNENATIYISTPSSDMFEEYEGFLEEFSQTTHILTSQGGTATMHIEKADSFHVKDLNSEVETIYTPNWQDPFITKKITTSHGSHFTVQMEFEECVDRSPLNTQLEENEEELYFEDETYFYDDYYEYFEDYLEDGRDINVQTQNGGTATLHLAKSNTYHVLKENGESITVSTIGWGPTFATKHLTTSHGSAFNVEVSLDKVILTGQSVTIELPNGETETVPYVETSIVSGIPSPFFGTTTLPIPATETAIPVFTPGGNMGTLHVPDPDKKTVTTTGGNHTYIYTQPPSTEVGIVTSEGNIVEIMKDSNYEEI